MTRGENDEVTMDNASISDTISKYYVNARKKTKSNANKDSEKGETLERWKQTPLKKLWVSGIKWMTTENLI